MKKLLALVLAAVMALSLVPAMAEEADAMTSASVADFYGDFAITGDDLMAALSSFSGFYILSTTNPDGTPNSAFFIFSGVKHEDKYYVQLGLAENQSRENLLRTGEALAVYAANPSSEEGAKPYAVAGARMTLSLVTDEAVLEALSVNARPGTLFCEITECKPLG